MAIDGRGSCRPRHRCRGSSHSSGPVPAGGHRRRSDQSCPDPPTDRPPGAVRTRCRVAYTASRGAGWGDVVSEVATVPCVAVAINLLDVLSDSVRIRGSEPGHAAEHGVQPMARIQLSDPRMGPELGSEQSSDGKRCRGEGIVGVVLGELVDPLPHRRIGDVEVIALSCAGFGFSLASINMITARGDQLNTIRICFGPTT